MSEPTAQPMLASERAYRLGEGPLWDAPRERVLWVNINAGDVHAATLRDGRLRAATTLTHFDETVGAAVCDPTGRLLVAGARSVLTPEGSMIALVDPGKNSRLNDGACDPAGRFLVGSMALDDRTGEECLYRLEHDATVTIIDDDLTLSNGLGFSPDGRVLYSVDTTPGIVYARPYDAATGAWGERWVVMTVRDGSPDGLCVDADGNLWIAVYGAGEVRCHTPDGRRRATIHIPARRVTSMAFVGPELDTLLITTASGDEPVPAGHLFTARAGVRGLPETPWAGHSR